MGSRALTTYQGKPGWERKEFGLTTGGTGNLDTLVRALLRSSLRSMYEWPSRDVNQAILMQEIYWVMSVLSRGLMQKASEATGDTMADTQPDSFVVRGETEPTAAKIRGHLRDGFRRVKLGENGGQRMRRGLRGGNCFGQMIYDWDGARWHMTGLRHMPTFEMVRNPADDSYYQVRNAKTIATWNNPRGDKGPNPFIANLSIESDDNMPYGVALFDHIKLDYRMFIGAIEDEVAAGRTRAVEKLKHIIGNPKGFMPVDENYIRDYRERNKIEPDNVVSHLWLKAGWEDVEVVKGDATGVRVLMEIVDQHLKRMRRGCGFRESPEDLSGRGLESAEAEYSGEINSLRLSDWKFKKTVGDQILLLEGYPGPDIDWSALLPPLGETDSNRASRMMNLYNSGLCGHEEVSAVIGWKDVDRLRQSIRETKAFNDEVGIQWPPKGKVTTQTRNPRGDVVGSESPKKGADPQQGRGRRQEQRKAGKTPSGA